MSNRIQLILKLSKETIIDGNNKNVNNWKSAHQDADNNTSILTSPTTSTNNIEPKSGNKNILESESNKFDQLDGEYQLQNNVELNNEYKKKEQNDILSENSLSDPFSSDDSYADPDFKKGSSTSSEEEEELENVKPNRIKMKQSRKRKVKILSEIVKKGKKRLFNPENWIKNHSKPLRNSGESYISSSSKKDVIASRKLLPPCTEKCKLQCYSKFSEEDRQKIFNDYWGLSNLEKQRHFLSASMTAINPKYRYVRGGSHRCPNNAFFFEIRGQKIRICKLFFKSTLCITDRPLRTVSAKRNLFTGQMLSSDFRGKHGHHAKVDENIKNQIRQHITLMPRIDSHYCRANTKKEFIEGGKTITELHRDYKNSCDEKNIPAGNYMMYARIFNEEFNLSFFVTKKDQCQLCNGYTNAVGDEKIKLQEKYDIHRIETDLSRKEKESDKKSDNIVAVYDLQAVLPCPSGEASSFYYVSKINVFNLTVCNILTKDVQCYVWHAAEAQRGVNEIGSCILRYLDMLVQNKDKDNTTPNQNKQNVIFYSDNCAGQQKNRFMIAAYMYAIFKYENLESIA